jgi:hypothetical protein
MIAWSALADRWHTARVPVKQRVEGFLGRLFGLFDDRVEVCRFRVNCKVLKDRVAVLALLKMLVLLEGQFAVSVYE